MPSGDPVPFPEGVDPEAIISRPNAFVEAARRELARTAIERRATRVLADPWVVIRRGSGAGGFELVAGPYGPCTQVEARQVVHHLGEDDGWTAIPLHPITEAR